MKKIPISALQKQPSGYSASVPLDFPIEAMFSIPESLLSQAIIAERIIGKLDGIIRVLPDIEFFLEMFAYKDATYSSQIEGTKATLSDALEATQKISTHDTDASDILFYIKALNYGKERLKSFPLSLRFIREIHQKLMEGARQTHFCDPGNFRTSQNWIGGSNLINASFVPVPHDVMAKSLGDLERFLYERMQPLSIVSIAYAHAQFETIHPFLDGNGRVGRLLITFLLMKERLLEAPALFLSAFFKKHQKLYYQKMHGYHHGEVFEWLEFFLEGVITTANEAIQVSQEVYNIKEHDMQKIQSLSKRESLSGVRVLNCLFQNPIVTTRSISEATGFTRVGSQKLIRRFIDLQILVERKQEINYDKKYTYQKYLQCFLKE